MRCRICNLPRKNFNRHDLWIEHQVCRMCQRLLEYFSWNNNFLKEYWMAVIDVGGKRV